MSTQGVADFESVAQAERWTFADPKHYGDCNNWQTIYPMTLAMFTMNLILPAGAEH